MAARRRRVVTPEGQGGPNPNSPAQQDEADILAEVGAVRDDDTGELVADEDKIREIGAVDAESVRENRRLDDIVNKKRGNVPGVAFNTGDVLTKYETIIRSWPPNTLDISMRRLTGQPVTHMITSRPRSGAELYEAIKALHGQHGEANYEIRIFDNNSKVLRGQGQITMPDTRAASPQQGQTMQPFYPGAPPIPPGYAQPQPVFGYPAPPPGYPTVPAQPQPPQQPQPQPQAAPQPMPAPTVQVMPSSFDPHSMMTMMDQMFGMFRQMQSAAQPPPQPAPPPPAPVPVQLPIQQMPPMPSPQASPAEMFQWMQQAFTMFQQLQAAQQPPATMPYVQPVLVQPPAPAPAPPPPSPQSGIAETMALMEQMFKMFQRMQPSAAPSPGPGPGPGPGYRGPRPPYYPQGDQGGPRPPYYPQGEPPPYSPQYPGSREPPPRERTAAEQFREAMMVVRTAVDAVQEMNALLPQQEAPAAAAAAPHEVDDDSPVQIIDTGPVKIAVNKSDGAMRWADTSMIALPGVLKWLGEQREAIQKESAARQIRQQPPPQQLPPGYVEVGPGYQPPPGFVAVPIDQQELPPPPAQMPPPIHSTPEPPPVRQAWGAPTIPTEGEGQ
jgi:hypothetical protein